VNSFEILASLRILPILGSGSRFNWTHLLPKLQSLRFVISTHVASGLPRLSPHRLICLTDRSSLHTEVWIKRCGKNSLLRRTFWDAHVLSVTSAEFKKSPLWQGYSGIPYHVTPFNPAINESDNLPFIERKASLLRGRFGGTHWIGQSSVFVRFQPIVSSVDS
jgi:hypothetical protein